MRGKFSPALRRAILVGLLPIVLASCAVGIVAPGNGSTGPQNPLPVVVSLPLNFDRHFEAKLGDRDITSLFTYDPFKLVTTASLSLSVGDYDLDVYACWKLTAFLPLGGCSSARSHFSVTPYLQVIDAGTGVELYVYSLRPKCTTGIDLRVLHENGSLLRDSALIPIQRVRGLVWHERYTFIATGCGWTDQAVGVIKLDLPPNAGETEQILFVVPKTYAANFPDYRAKIQRRVDATNTIFEQSGIRKHMVIGAIKQYDDESPDCLFGDIHDPNIISDPCFARYDAAFFDVGMTTYFNTYGLVGASGIGALPEIRAIYTTIAANNPNRDFFNNDSTYIPLAVQAAYMAHELAHTHYAGTPEGYDHLAHDKSGEEPFFVPDGFYLYHNKTVPERYRTDPMVLSFELRFRPLSDFKFGPLNAKIIEDNTAFDKGGDVGFNWYYWQYYPWTISVELRDSSGSPIAGASGSYWCVWKSEVYARASFETNSSGNAVFPAPIPLLTDCNVMALKFVKPGYLPTVKTLTSMDLAEASLVYNKGDIYVVSIVMPPDAENTSVSCASPEKRIAVTAKSRNDVTIDWCASDSAPNVTYEAALRAEGDFDFSWVESRATTSDTRATFTGLTPATRYRVYVAARKTDCPFCLPLFDRMEGIVTTAP